MKNIIENFNRVIRSYFNRDNDRTILEKIPEYMYAQREKAIVMSLLFILLLFVLQTFCRTNITREMFIVNLSLLIINIFGLLIVLTGRLELGFLFMAYINMFLTMSLFVFLIFKGEYSYRPPIGTMFYFCIIQFYVIIVSAFFVGRHHTIIIGGISTLYMIAMTILISRRTVGGKMFLDNMLVPILLFTCAIIVLIYFINLFNSILNKLLELKNNLQDEINLQTKAYLAEKEKAESANMAKNIFLANISHELRTPLNSILGFSELNIKNPNDPNKYHYDNLINSAGKELLALVNDLLDVSMIEAGGVSINYEAVNLREIINKTKNNFLFALEEKGIKLNIFFDDKIPGYIKTDSKRLRQIIVNLLSNAIKHTSAGKIVISAEMNNRDLSIKISDTGTGIEQLEFEKIFQMFYQSKKNIKAGAGIGLSIVKQFTELLGGKVFVESKIGEGSSFTIVFYNIESIDIKDNSVFLQNSFNEIFLKGKCLVVDDFEPNRIYIIQSLKNTGLELYEAESGEEALAAVNKIKPDIILLDIKLPDIDGYEVLRRLKENSATSVIPVIAVTAGILPDDELKIKTAGFNALIKKPVAFEELAASIKIFLYPKTDGKNEMEFKDAFTLLAESERNEIAAKLIEIDETGSLTAIEKFGEFLTLTGSEKNIKLFKTFGDSIIDSAKKTHLSEIQRIIKYLQNELNVT